jgi:hypothetical protein
LLLPADGGYTFPPERRGDLVANLNVEVPEGSGPARAEYTLTVRGGPALEVDAPQLSDPAAAWTARRSSAWALAGGRVTWAEVIELEQAKPGLVPLPDVKLRFRDGPSAEWQEAEWKDVLKDVREPPGPEVPPAGAAPARNRWLPAVSAAAVAAALLAAAAVRWRRRGVEPPLPPDRRALRELDRLAGLAGSPAHDAEWFFTQLADVVRRYLAERLGLPALQRTTAEFLRAAAGAAPLAGQVDRLRELLELCDVAKFAGVGAGPAERGRAVERARSLVRRLEDAAGGAAYPERAKPAEQAPP